MKMTIEGTPKEIAALVVAIQERPELISLSALQAMEEAMSAAQSSDWSHK